MTGNDAGSDDGVSLLSAIDAAITAMTKNLGEKDAAKGSVTDLVRLLQLRKDLDDERPRHVTARWIGDECNPSID